MEYIFSHLSQTLIVIGLILLAIEVLVLGFSTFVLFFVGIGTIATGILMLFGVIPETLLNSLLAIAIISSLVALLSWKPMKRMQNSVELKQVNNDMIGHQFILSEALNIGQTITHRYSGIDWQVKAKEQLPIGTEVKIISMEVGVLTVQQVIPKELMK
jgi:membrane protein implicated in regulation of membrane protease activity